VFGMNEYLMIAHELEKARLLSRDARKSRHRKERSGTRFSSSPSVTRSRRTNHE
jgi:hypothetical protein